MLRFVRAQEGAAPTLAREDALRDERLDGVADRDPADAEMLDELGLGHETAALVDELAVPHLTPDGLAHALVKRRALVGVAERRRTLRDPGFPRHAGALTVFGRS